MSSAVAASFGTALPRWAFARALIANLFTVNFSVALVCLRAATAISPTASAATLTTEIGRDAGVLVVIEININ